MWHDAITFSSSDACAADRARVCRFRIFGDVRICVKCGEPRRLGDGSPVRVERRLPGRTPQERRAAYHLARAIELANMPDLPF